MPIRHQSGRSDISSDRGHTSPGSYPSTMEAPPSNQDGLHRIQVIQRTQEVFGRTLSHRVRVGVPRTSVRVRSSIGSHIEIVTLKPAVTTSPKGEVCEYLGFGCRSH